MLTEALLEKFRWYDISITRMNDDDTILIVLIFETMKQGNEFGALLDTNYYKFAVSKNSKGEFIFVVDFIDTEFSLIFNSHMTEESYPPVLWLGTGADTYITNGIWDKEQIKGQKRFRYNPEILALDNDMNSMSLEESIAKAFSLAKRIDFLTSPGPGQPSAVALVFDRRQAVTAYNNLFDLANSKTTFLKIEELDNLNISFIDGVNDFDITILNLPYSSSQLTEFKEKIYLEKEFAFVLRLDDEENEHPIIIATKEKFEVITLAGFFE